MEEGVDLGHDPGNATSVPCVKQMGVSLFGPMPPPVLRAERLTRTFGPRRAVDAVSIELGAGDCLALFGPNGAGKTTLLRLLGGLLKPSDGAATIGGVKLPGGPDVRSKVGLLSHHTLLYEALTARENVEFAARLYGVSDMARVVEQQLARIGASGYADTPVKLLSRGMQQRVSIARAIVHGPAVVLADEPFTGLDAAGAATLSEMFAELRDTGATLVIVTHNLDEALSLCTHAAIMRAGARLLRLDTTPIRSWANTRRSTKSCRSMPYSLLTHRASDIPPGVLRAAFLDCAQGYSLVELRTQAAPFSPALAFSVLGLTTICFFAWDPTAVPSADLAPGVLWVVFTFSGLLGLHRSFSTEQPTRAIDALVAAPVGREALFLGKALANVVFVALVQLVTVPAAALLL